jgi:catechol 2,3-dioxygenase-like lactoylglutathione lyase family enzyme/nitrite reductase/ring-hydroxylating ferredoxin subunit
MSLVSGLNHLTVHVSDLDRSEAFYRDVFGLDIVGRDLVSEEGPNSLLKTDNGHMFLLVEVKDKILPFRPNSAAIHHALSVTVEQHKRITERRAAADFPIADTRAAFRARGQISLDVFDPDGHRYQVQAIGADAYEILKAAKGKVDCGSAEDFAVGSVTHFKEAQFYLVRRDEGFIAMSHWCTHMNGELRWRPEHWSFYCPFHKAIYNRKGESLSHMKGLPPLRLHPLEIGSDGHVVVDTNELTIRKDWKPEQAVPCAAAAACATAAAR